MDSFINIVGQCWASCFLLEHARRIKVVRNSRCFMVDFPNHKVQRCAKQHRFKLHLNFNCPFRGQEVDVCTSTERAALVHERLEESVAQMWGGNRRHLH